MRGLGAGADISEGPVSELAGNRRARCSPLELFLPFNSNNSQREKAQRRRITFQMLHEHTSTAPLTAETKNELSWEGKYKLSKSKQISDMEKLMLALQVSGLQAWGDLKEPGPSHTLSIKISVFLSHQGSAPNPGAGLCLSVLPSKASWKRREGSVICSSDS